MLLRVDPAEADALTSLPRVRRFEMRGKELSGWLHLDAAALDREEELRRWVAKGLAYARSLPT